MKCPACETENLPEARFCASCGMFQIIEQPPPESMFHREYSFFTRTSQHMVRHFSDLGETVRREFLQGDDPFVVEIGSNDGALLEGFAQAGIRHLGVDPSANIAAIAERSGVRTLVDFFNQPTAAMIADTEHVAIYRIRTERLVIESGPQVIGVRAVRHARHNLAVMIRESIGQHPVPLVLPMEQVGGEIGFFSGVRAIENEISEAGLCEDLWQRRRVPESIRQAGDRAVAAEVRL